MDLTLIELFVTILIAGTKLWFQGQRILPSMDMLRRVLFIGGLHLTGCRFFVYSLSLGVPVSLAQTIRAMNPLFAVMIGVCVGERYQRAVLLSLIPIVVGFGLAVSADLDVEPIGVAASIGSVLCLACVNFLSKAVNDDPKQEVTVKSRRPLPTPSQSQPLPSTQALIDSSPFLTPQHHPQLTEPSALTITEPRFQSPSFSALSIFLAPTLTLIAGDF